MHDGEADFSALLERFAKLGRADRKAIMANLSAEERIVFEQAIAAEEGARSAEESRRRQADRQFLGYSPWLAALVEGALKRDEVKLAPEAAKALVVSHGALIADQGIEPRDGWRGALDRISDLLFSKKGSTQ